MSTPREKELAQRLKKSLAGQLHLAEQRVALIVQNAALAACLRENQKAWATLTPEDWDALPQWARDAATKSAELLAAMEKEKP